MLINDIKHLQPLPPTHLTYRCSFVAVWCLTVLSTLGRLLDPTRSQEPSKGARTVLVVPSNIIYICLDNHHNIEISVALNNASTIANIYMGQLLIINKNKPWQPWHQRISLERFRIWLIIRIFFVLCSDWPLSPCYFLEIAS